MGLKVSHASVQALGVGVQGADRVWILFYAKGARDEFGRGQYKLMIFFFSVCVCVCVWVLAF